MTADSDATPPATASVPSEPAAAAAFLAWRRCGLTELVTMGIGTLLFMLGPVWLVPPWYVYTPYLYVALFLAWVPVLLICALVRPSGNLEWAHWLSSPCWLTLVQPLARGCWSRSA